MRSEKELKVPKLKKVEYKERIIVDKQSNVRYSCIEELIGNGNSNVEVKKEEAPKVLLGNITFPDNHLIITPFLSYP